MASPTIFLSDQPFCHVRSDREEGNYCSYYYIMSLTFIPFKSNKLQAAGLKLEMYFVTFAFYEFKSLVGAILP